MRQKADSTLRSSRAVPHPSTNRALRRLTSEFGRDPVHSTRYGRQRQYLRTSTSASCSRPLSRCRSRHVFVHPPLSLTPPFSRNVLSSASAALTATAPFTHALYRPSPQSPVPFPCRIEHVRVRHPYFPASLPSSAMQVGGPQKTVYTSRFVRVILAQGPC